MIYAIFLEDKFVSKQKKLKFLWQIPVSGFQTGRVFDFELRKYCVNIIHLGTDS